MLAFLKNFWVCLGVALFCSWQAATSYTEGDTGWAWLLGILALMWLNDARRAMQREANDEEESSEG